MGLLFTIGLIGTAVFFILKEKIAKDMEKIRLKNLEEEHKNKIEEIQLSWGKLINVNKLYINNGKKDFYDDKDIVLEVVQKDGSALKYASNNLKNDKNIVLEAVRQDGSALKYTSNNLKNDKDIVLEAVRQNGSALKYASNKFKNDKDIVLEAVRQDGSALKYTSNNLKNDKDIVLEAVRQKWF